jgi:ABC-type uncharacterized transport system substrate-binding protein
MPQKEISQTTRSVLTLINNAHDLIVYSNKRKEAKDVVRALKAFARDKNYSLPEQKIDNFLSVLLDSRPNTLSYLLTDIAKTIVDKQ